MKHFYHHCGICGHTRPNCFKLHTLKRDDSQHAQGMKEECQEESKLRKKMVVNSLEIS